MQLGRYMSALIAGAVLLSSVIGHPLNIKRVIVTEVQFDTKTIADAVIFVDEDGIPYLTSTLERVISIPTAAVEPTAAFSSSAIPIPYFAEPSPVSLIKSFVTPFTSGATTSSLGSFSAVSDPVASSVVVQSPTATTAPSPSLTEPPTPFGPFVALSSKIPEQLPLSSHTPSLAQGSGAPESPAAPEPKTSAESDDQFPLGITYDTFKGSSESIQCKSKDEMVSDFERMKNFGIIRIYGNDCGVISVAVQQAKRNGQKIMAGIYTPNQQVDAVVNALTDAVKEYNDGSWDIIGLVSVENERVNAHVITASDAQDTISQARQALRNAGYFGPVGAVETVPAVVDNPSICVKSDMTLVNIHAFFDPNTRAEGAGEFVKSEVSRVKKACPDKRVIVTESGWPHQGDSHDQAVVSLDAQKAAIDSIKRTFNHDLFLFNAFDSLWKTDDSSTFNSERFWGVL